MNHADRLTMPLGDAIYSMRAIRRLKPDPIADADLHAIIEAAIQAPSGWKIREGTGPSRKLKSSPAGYWSRTLRSPTSDTRYRARMRVERLIDQPIIHPSLDPSIGGNIQGPSLIRVPDWVDAPLGRYYCYFADHKGSYIRLAYADALTGPWRIHVPGALQLAESHFLTELPSVSDHQRAAIEAQFAAGAFSMSHDPVTEATTPHVASPDAHVDHDRRRIRLYYHGLEGLGVQCTRVAESGDGIHFTAQPEVLGRSYFRVFPWGSMTYALAMPGRLYRSSDGLTGFEEGPLLFNPDMRHAALHRDGDTLAVFWTQVGDTPERIYHSAIDLRGDWHDWTESSPVEVLRPERPWEGADAPLEPSVRSTAYGHVNQLRDPATYAEDGRLYLLYAVAGESGIAIAEVVPD